MSEDLWRETGFGEKEGEDFIFTCVVLYSYLFAVYFVVTKVVQQMPRKDATNVIRRNASSYKLRQFQRAKEVDGKTILSHEKIPRRQQIGKKNIL